MKTIPKVLVIAERVPMLFAVLPENLDRVVCQTTHPRAFLSHATQIQIKTYLVTRPCHMDRKFAAANRTNELGTPCV